jgi:hypothetical protein
MMRHVEVSGTSPKIRQTLARAEADVERWFNDPRYGVAERVFDEDGVMDCSLTSESDSGRSS